MPPENCSISNSTDLTLHVKCQSIDFVPSYSTETMDKTIYWLQLLDEFDGRLLANFSSSKSPVFKLELPPPPVSERLRIRLFAANRYGHSSAITLAAHTLLAAKWRASTIESKSGFRKNMNLITNQMADHIKNGFFLLLILADDLKNNSTNSWTTKNVIWIVVIVLAITINTLIFILYKLRQTSNQSTEVQSMLTNVSYYILILLI